MWYSIFNGDNLLGQFVSEDAAREWAINAGFKSYFILHVIDYVK